MNVRYSIVPATREHLAAVPLIEQAAARLFSEKDLPPEIRFLVTDPETLLQAQQKDRMWVALQNEGTPVGFAYAVILGSEAHLDEMDVHPDHGRRGIGTRLLETVIDWGRSCGYAGLTLITFRHLPWNAPFYARLGFEPLPPKNTNAKIRSLIAEEGRAGINTANRIAMRLKLR